jgi:hypothetical protein
VGGDVLGRQVARAVDDEPRAAPRSRPDRVNDSAPAKHCPQTTGALTAQHPARPSVQHDRDLTAARSDRPVPDTVNTAVKAVEPAGRDKVIHHAGAQARPKQLKPRHHPVLARPERRHDFEWSGFTGYRGVKPLHPAILPPPASPNNAEEQQDRAETPRSLSSRRCRGPRRNVIAGSSRRARPARRPARTASRRRSCGPGAPPRPRARRRRPARAAAVRRRPRA